ncbi:hypothetical protein BH10PSE13_BH10PSE13_24480 [soil metagenome]
MTSGNDPRPSNPIGAGAPIALLLIAGVVVGGLFGQPSVGFLVGLMLGIGVAVVTWRLRK